MHLHSYDKTYLKRFHSESYEEQIKEVTRQAKHIQSQVPGVTWGECIRIAEKWSSERS